MQFVVLGNGIAGITAASTIRRLKKEASVTIVTKEPYPAYSACILPNYLSGETDKKGVFIKDLADYSRDNINLILSQKAVAIDVDPRNVLLESESIKYDKLIVSTGSQPIMPPIKGIDKKGVFTFKSLDDVDNICNWNGQTVAVVGSGPIGVEASIALKQRGCEVFLIELLERILPQVFDDDAASLVKKILESHGISVFTHESVTEMMGTNIVHGVITDRRVVKCDAVILATGMKPENDLVGGVLERGEFGGITVDDRMGTNIQDVFACGDCIEAQSLIDGKPTLSFLWHNARWQGEVAGSNAAGVPRTYAGSLNITGVDVFGVQAVSIGSIVGDKGFDAIEIKRDEAYVRLVLSNGLLIGVQSINWYENLGPFLATILRKEKINTCKEMTPLESLSSKDFRYFPFGPKPWSRTHTK